MMFYILIMYRVVRDAQAFQSMQELLEPLIRKVVSMIRQGYVNSIVLSIENCSIALENL